MTSRQAQDRIKRSIAKDTERHGKQGSLKIFMGYSPGVGKTNAMLQAGQEAQQAGTDVAVGFIRHHNRPETIALLRSLNTAPLLRYPEDDTEAGEFDLDQALRRKPQLLLLDDLAHTNDAGCRHKRRYQDVEELLRAGIDVYTTINIQQLESLTDTLSSIIEVSSLERVPDHVVEHAGFVDFIDMEPRVLAKRFRSGMVFQSEENMALYAPLFQEEKLLELRGLALRVAANLLTRLATQVSPRNDKAEPQGRDHILVCVSSAASNKKVIRSAARMAEAFHSRFTALFVETPESTEQPPLIKAVLQENLRLAEQLGAQIATVYGEDIPLQIAEYARNSGVSKIVLGRSPHSKQLLARSTVVDRLVSLVPDTETYIIPYPRTPSRKKRFGPVKLPWLSAADAGKAAAVLALCTLVGFWFHHLRFREANIITVYIMGILLLATVTKGPVSSAIASVGSVLIFDYFFTEPRYSLHAYDSNYFTTFLMMLAASFLTSTLTMAVKNQARQAARKAYRTEALLETSRKLQQAENYSAIIDETARQMVKLLDRTVVFYPVEQEQLAAPKIYPKEENEADLASYTGEYELTVADWVFRNNKRAGATTDTFSGAQCLYHAVRGGENVYAVVAVVMNPGEPIEIFERSLMIAMLGECALALEKERLNEQQKEIFGQIQQEQLRANLLRGISHDLRTPLTSISGNAAVLIGNSEVLNEEQKQSLYTDIHDDSIWLIQLVENVLAISRIENGTLGLNFQAELIEDVLLEALQHVRRDKDSHILETNVQDELLMASMDSRLMVQVLVNLIDNALKYTGPGTAITISARQDQDMVLVEVADHGPGIPDIHKARIFETFYTLQNKTDGRRGLGLGLSLCKSIIQAHGGEIGLRDNRPRGTVFWFTIPVSEVNVHE